MIIRHKGVYNDRYDAPFVGTLVSSISCPYNCRGCINDPLKPLEYQETDSEEILDSISNNGFNTGIILAGLEWSLQPDEMICLVSGALDRGLDVMIYTYHKDRDALLHAVPELNNYVDKGIYVKYGKYDDTKIVHDNVQYGVPLVTSNQYIELL